MPDPRIQKFAQTLINFCLEIKPRQQLAIFSNYLAEELVLETYAEALKAGAFVVLMTELPGAWETFYKHANDEQLDYVNPVFRTMVDQFDARLSIGSEQNTRALTNIDPHKRTRRQRAMQPYSKTFLERAARNEMRWCSTAYPTHASAQEADLSLDDYREFVFEACGLNEPDPAAFWENEGRRMRILQDWLKGRDRVVLRGSDIDLTMSIKDRDCIPSDGKYNFPDGELFTGPVEDSVNGWVRFRYPAIYAGTEVRDVELWFENGRVVRECASKGQEALTALLDTDEGSRYLGEWGIGTNYHIQRFSKDMLFDEKIGGTIHLALGASYPETGGKNESGLHWDMLCDMHEAEILVDGDLFYKDGKPVLWT